VCVCGGGGYKDTSQTKTVCVCAKFNFKIHNLTHGEVMITYSRLYRVHNSQPANKTVKFLHKHCVLKGDKKNARL
jgi:hypothetical protein